MLSVVWPESVDGVLGLVGFTEIFALEMVMAEAEEPARTSRATAENKSFFMVVDPLSDSALVKPGLHSR